MAAELTEAQLVELLIAIRHSEDAYDREYGDRLIEFLAVRSGGAPPDKDDDPPEKNTFDEIVFRGFAEQAARRLIENRDDEQLVTFEESKAAILKAVEIVNEGDPGVDASQILPDDLLQKMHEHLVYEILGVASRDHATLRRRIDASLAAAGRWSLAPEIFLSLERSWEDVLREIYTPDTYRAKRVAQYDFLIKQYFDGLKFTVEVKDKSISADEATRRAAAHLTRLIKDTRAAARLWVETEIKYLWPDPEPVAPR